MQHAEHRERIAGLLEPIYRRKDWWQKLVVILDAQLDYVEDRSRRVEMLRDDLPLSASLSGNDLVLRWPAGPPANDFVAESTVSLSSPQWQPVPGAPEVQNGFSQLRLPLNAPTRFFRLIQSP